MTAGHWRTRRELRFDWTCQRMTWPLVIPAGTRCKPITEGGTAGKFWIDDLRWINRETHGFMVHDAEHYGIVIEAAEVEPA